MIIFLTVVCLLWLKESKMMPMWRQASITCPLWQKVWCVSQHPHKDNCQSYIYNQKWHVWHDANVKTNVNCVCFGQMWHVWHDATVNANTKSTNHICLININVLKEIHIPCHPTHIISANYKLISNDMDKLGITLLHNF